MNMFTKLSEFNKLRYRRAAAVLIAVLMAVTVVLPLQTAGTYAASSSASELRPPTITKVTRSKKKVKVKWKQVPGVSGYQVQCSRSPVFLNAFSKKAKSPSKTSRTFKNFGKGGSCYVRIRSYRKVNGKTYWSPWGVVSNARKTRAFPLEPLKMVKIVKVKAEKTENTENAEKEKEKEEKRVVMLELREAAGQKVYGYDTVQGSCHANGYIYYVLENRYAKKCKIAKLSMASRRVVKVSAPLKLHHGNGMTFNTNTKELVVAHSTGAPKKISVIDPVTLKIKYNKTITMPEKFEKLPGVPKYTGFGAIAYNGAHNGYVILLRGTKNHNLVILDAKFRPVKYMKTKVKIDQTVQAIDSYGDYILAAQSPSSGRRWNNVLVYDWNGDFQFRAYVSGEELESIFHDGKNFYATFYRKHYERKLISDEGFFKKVFLRDGYIYKIKGL